MTSSEMALTPRIMYSHVLEERTEKRAGSNRPWPASVLAVLFVGVPLPSESLFAPEAVDVACQGVGKRSVLWVAMGIVVATWDGSGGVVDKVEVSG